MFRCNDCREVQKPLTPATRIVVERRDRVYKSPDGAIIARGWEIAREKLICPTCAKEQP